MLSAILPEKNANSAQNIAQIRVVKTETHKEKRLGNEITLKRRTIFAAGLIAKGVGAEDRAAALQALRETAADPDLAAACAFAGSRNVTFGDLYSKTLCNILRTV